MIAVLAQHNETRENRGIDLIFVIDNSGSMVHADPDKRAQDAPMLMIDNLLNHRPSGENAYPLRFGVVMYDEGIVDSATIGLMSAETSQDREHIRRVTHDNYNQEGNHTDTPAGLAEALRLFEQDDAGNRRYIVLITDGLANNPQRFPEFTEENYREDVLNRPEERLDALREETLDRLAELHIPIFAIGFQFGDAPSLEASIEEMTSRTGGRHFMISSSEGFHTQILVIFGAISGLAVTDEEAGTTQPEQDFNFTVPDSYLASVTMNILTTIAQDVEIEVFFENQDMTDNPRIAVFQAPSYVNINIQSPEKGEWRVHMRGEEGVDYWLQYIYDYRIGIDKETQTDTTSGSEFLIGRLAAEGVPVTDLDIYNNVNSAIFSIFDSSGNFIADFHAEPFGEGYRFNLQHLGRGDYSAIFSIEHEYFSRTSTEPIFFSLPLIEPPPPEETEGEEITEIPEIPEEIEEISEPPTPTDYTILGIIMIISGIIVLFGAPYVISYNRKFIVRDAKNPSDNGEDFLLTSKKSIIFGGMAFDGDNYVAVNVREFADDSLAKISISPIFLYGMGVVLVAESGYLVNEKQRVSLKSGANDITISQKPEITDSDDDGESFATRSTLAEAQIEISIDREIIELYDDDDDSDDYHATNQIEEKRASPKGGAALDICRILAPLLVIVGVIIILI